MDKIWRVNSHTDRDEWIQRASLLMRTLESQGCEIDGFKNFRNDDTSIVYLPGLDTFLLPALGSLPSSLPSHWIRFASSLLWERAELTLNSQTRTIRCSWIYWSPVQILMHGSICGLFLVKGLTQSDLGLLEWWHLLLGCGILNGLAILLSWYEQTRLNRLFNTCGFVAESTSD